jgi:hypothetical protein
LRGSSAGGDPLGYPAVPVPAVTISAIAQEIVLAAAGRPAAW